jgi:hypothetical protein
LITDLDAFAAEGGDLVSSSQGYQSQYPTGSSDRSSVQVCGKKKSRLQPFRDQGETLEHASAGGPLKEPNNEVGSGDQSSPPRRSSPGSWFSNSSPNQSGGAAFEPPSHHPEHHDDVGDEQPLTASSHSIEMEVDDLAMGLHHCPVRWCRTDPLLRAPVLSQRQIQE